VSRFDQLLDFFSFDHRYRDEIRQWQASGQYPDEIVRRYTNEKVRLRDFRRMTDLGYDFVGQANSPMNSAARGASVSTGGGIYVTYRKKLKVMPID